MTIIPGATDPTFVLTTDQLGQRLFCKVTAQNDFGTAAQNSNVVGPVTDPAPAFTTWDPANKTTNMELSNGNLTARTDDTAAFARQTARGTVSRSSGKRYFECRLDSVGDLAAIESRISIGICDSVFPIVDNTQPPGVIDSLGCILDLGSGFSGLGIAQAGGVGWSTNAGTRGIDGDVIGCAVDLDLNLAWWYNNGVILVAGADPTAGAAGNGLDWGSTAGAAMFPCITQTWQAVVPVIATLNAGSTPFVLAPLPTGFVAWG